MEHIKLFEDFIPMGFGTNNSASFSLSGTRNIGTGYDMNVIVGPVQQLGNHIATEAGSYEKNDNPEHTAKGYIQEAKKHINEIIDEACNEYANANEANEVNELALTSTGVKGLLQAIYYNWDKIKDQIKSKYFMTSFRDVIAFIKSGDQEEQKELETIVKDLGIVVLDLDDKRTWDIK